MLYCSKAPSAPVPSNFQKKSAKFNHQNTFHHKSISKKKLTPTENDSNSARSLLDVASRVSVGPEVERKFRSFCVVCCLEALYGGYFCVCACMHFDDSVSFLPIALFSCWGWFWEWTEKMPFCKPLARDCGIGHSLWPVATGLARGHCLCQNSL